MSEFWVNPYFFEGLIRTGPPADPRPTSIAMAAKLVACTALVASAAAFAPATGALRTVRTGASSLTMKIGDSRAPIITIFDHRGCTRGGKEYKGKLLGTQDDEMCVKVQMQSIPRSNARATAQLQESISLKAKGIDGPYSATGTEYVHERACACTSRCKC